MAYEWYVGYDWAAWYDQGWTVKPYGQKPASATVYLRVHAAGMSDATTKVLGLLNHPWLLEDGMLELEGGA